MAFASLCRFLRSISSFGVDGSVSYLCLFVGCSPLHNTWDGVLLAVGVVPPLPYLPLPYPLPLLVGVVPPDPELLVLLPQAAKTRTSVATMRTVHHARLETFEMERLCCIMGSSLASMGTSNGTT